jgi:membrane protein
MDATAVLTRILDEPRVARVRAVLDIYGRAAGGLLANGLAFSALFAAIPTTLLVLGLAGLIAAGNETIRETVTNALVAAFPPLADLIQGSLNAFSGGAALTSIIGVVGVIWTVSQFYGALDVAFARIFAGAPERDVLRRTARGLLVVALIAGAVVVFIVLVSLSTLFDAVSADIPIASAVAGAVGSVLFLAAVAIAAVLLIYRTLPPHAPSWHALVLPGVVVGFVIVILSQIFTTLVPRLVGVAALAGSLASAFIALAWLSFTFQAVLYGAAWVRVRDEGVKAAGSTALEGSAAAAEPGAGRQ